ncbi:aminodeoxychorismate synthase component I, partial [Corynebacterium heidelbergense]
PTPTTAHYRFDKPKTHYMAAVRKCQAFIAAGESYEICLTNTATGPALPDPWQTYRRLRAISPVPYGAYIRHAQGAHARGPLAILSASPERFLQVSATGEVEAKPIKGTRPRGVEVASDRKIRRELHNSPKDRAENLMIVDLLRNDLSRVCETGSVHVPVLFGIESFSHVHQMVSTIRGRLREGCSAVDCLSACFPGGSMTGAPKVRTMEIIEELEDRARGFYSGAIGWFGFDGAADLSITIRTIISDATSTSFGVGGAVVADSDPGEEWEETLVKARPLLEALHATVD